MESEGKEENLGPVSLVAENPEVMRPSHNTEENDIMLKASVPSYETPTLITDKFDPQQEFSSHPKSSENLISAEDSKNQVLDVDVEKAGSLEPDCNSKASLRDVKDIDSRATKSSSETGKDVVTEILPRDCFVEDTDGGQNFKKKIMHSGTESRDMKQLPSRSGHCSLVR